jgi:DNA primase
MQKFKFKFILKSKPRLKSRIKDNFYFRQEDINIILKNVSTFEVLSKYLVLTRKGSDFECYCPRCKDFSSRTLMRVSKRLNRYKCFRCGNSGATPMTFLIMYHNCTFNESIKIILKNFYRNTNIKEIATQKYAIEMKKSEFPF